MTYEHKNRTVKLLALDTATEACSAALWQDGQLLQRYEVAGRTHTELVMPMTEGLMAEAGCAFSQLDGIVCGVGPGSFAGVRIGVGFVKGLALALDRPVVGVSSLAMLAQAEITRGAQNVLAAIDARMGEIYWGVYRRDSQGLARLEGLETVCKPVLPEMPAADWFGIGTGWGTYSEALRAGVKGTLLSADGTALPRAEHALKLAIPVFESGQGIRSDELTPVYLRNKVALTLLEQRQLKAAG